MPQRAPSAFVIWIALTLTFCAAQGPTPQNLKHDTRMRGTIRVEVAETPVDVIVVDPKGRPVLDLKRDDFVVFEDGVEQSIIHFALNSYVSDTPAATLSPPDPQDAQTRPALSTPGQRTFVICFGAGWHGRLKAIDKAADFVRTRLRPSDRVALMAYNRATDFTNDHARVVQTIEKYKRLSQEIETRTQLASGQLHRGIILQTQQARIDEIFTSPGAAGRQTMAMARPDEELREVVDRETIANARDVDVKWTMVDGAEMALRFSEDMMNQRYQAALEMDDYLRVSVRAVDDIPLLISAVQYLRYMEGEKHLLYLTPQGFFLRKGNDDIALASMASDARVRMHILQTGGVELREPVPGMDISNLYQKQQGATATSPPRAKFDAYAQFPVEEMERFASLTGGHAYSGMNLNKAFQAISEQTAQSYLLGYAPPALSPAGRFREISVSVKRPGLRVFHRHGYYDQAAERIFDREQFLTCSRVTAALEYTEPITEIAFDLEGSGQRKGDSARLRSKLTVHPKPELYTEAPGPQHTGKLYVAYFVMDGRGRILFRTTDDLTMELKPETYQQVMSEGFPLEKEFIAKGPTKDFWLKVVLFDPKNDRVGSALQKVKIK